LYLSLYLTHFHFNSSFSQFFSVLFFHTAPLLYLPCSAVASIGVLTELYLHPTKSKFTPVFFSEHCTMAGQRRKKVVEKFPCSARKKINLAQLEIKVCKPCKEVSVSEDDQTVTCECCKEFICISCSKLSSEEYLFLQKTKLLHWFCRDCEKPTLGAQKSG